MFDTLPVSVREGRTDVASSSEHDANPFEDVPVECGWHDDTDLAWRITQEMTSTMIAERTVGGPNRHEGSMPGLPAGIDSLPPTHPLVPVALAATDTAALSPADKVAALRVRARMVAHHQAEMYAAMAAIHDEYIVLSGGEDPEVDFDATTSELRAALHLTRRAAESELSFASDLRDRFPTVLRALQNGSIDLRRARVMVEGVGHLHDDAAQAVLDKVLEWAADQTTGQLRALLRKLCIEIDPDEAAQRYEDAHADRLVALEPNHAGTATLVASDLDPARGASIMDRISRIARSLKTRTETRTMDQLRADVVCDLLEGRTVGDATRGPSNARPGKVDIRIELTTLMGLDHKAVELAGFGPVVADIGRRLALDPAAGQWQVSVTNRGRVLDTAITRRRPTANQRRRVEHRDQTCVFPGCRMPASGCDLDHRVPYAVGGPTDEGNLAGLCRHDHGVRHRSGWSYRLQPDGSTLWSSPLGTTYTRPPP